MSKVKVALLILLVIILMDFAFENPEAHPDLKLFKVSLGQSPTYLLVYASLTLGLVIGWTGHALRERKKRKRQAAALQEQVGQSQEDK
jgi:uncharacterized integral membrane protein